MKEVQRREPKEDDQENIEYAYHAIQEVFDGNPQVDGSIFSGALISHLVGGYIQTGITPAQFREELDKMEEYYKKMWEEND